LKNLFEQFVIALSEAYVLPSTQIWKIDELDKWDKRFLELALHIASWSKDPNTKVGSVIVAPDHRVMSLGYNGFPRGVTDSIERLTNRDEKLKFVSHSERNALDNCDTNIRGCTMYTTLQPCVDCTKSIIQRGIVKVVCIVNLERKDQYGHDDFINYSLCMMNEAGVKVVQVQL
jgi:dCMP deaminase